MKLALIPGVPALLPEYAGLADPVPALREATSAAGQWLVEGGPSQVVVAGATPGDLAARVADAVLGTSRIPLRAAGLSTNAEAVLVVANGSARRGEKAPGHLDARSFDFDHEVGSALKTGDLDALAGLDLDLADELLTSGLGTLAELAGRLARWQTREVLFDEDPYGVQYWVVTVECGF